MNKKYKAFISYNKNDIKAATILQRAIETYIIPRKLRKNNQKYVGKIFRDKDELNLTENLPETIKDAMVNSEYLIVLCSSHSVESQWVSREISLFLDLHNHDHSKIIPVLLEGYSEKTVPNLLLKDNGIEYEVLAVDFTNVNLCTWNRTFQSELQRIIASFISCPYSELVNRKKQRELYKYIAYMGIFSFLMLIFCGIMINRNNLIKEKNKEIQQEESTVLSMLSSSSLANGDRYDAIRQAYTALPHNDNRPYSSKAELSLTEALTLYQPDSLKCNFSFSADSGNIYLSPNGNKIAVGNRSKNTLQCIDSITEKIIWSRKDIDTVSATFSPDGTLLYVAAYDGITKVNTENGQTIDEYKSVFFINTTIFSESTKYIAVATHNSEEVTVQLIDTDKMEMVSTYSLKMQDIPHIVSCQGVFSDDCSYLALAVNDLQEINKTYIYVIDVISNKVICTLEFLPYNYILPTIMSFSPDNNLLVGEYNVLTGNCELHLITFNGNCSEKWKYIFEYKNTEIFTKTGMLFQPSTTVSLSETFVYIASGNEITILNKNTGEFYNSIQVGGDIVNLYLFPDLDYYILTLYNGTVTIGMPDGTLGYELDYCWFDVGQNIIGTVSTGERYLSCTLLFETLEDQFIVYNNFSIPEFEIYDETKLPDVKLSESIEFKAEMIDDTFETEADIVGMEKVPEHDEIYVFSDNGDVIIFNSKTREELAYLNLSKYGWSFDQTTSFNMYVLPEDRILLVAKNQKYTTPLNAVFDVKLRELVEIHNGIMGYDSEAGNLILQSPLGNFYSCDYLSLEEKMEIAECILNKEEIQWH